MNPKLLTIIKEQARNTMTTIGLAVSVVYIMKHLGFDGEFFIPYKSYWSIALGWFIGLVLKAYYSEQD